MDGWAEENRLHPRVCAANEKVFQLLTLASRCRPISKASLIQQAAGGCCRSTLRAPGRRKPKKKTMCPLRPPPMMCLSIHTCWKGKTRKYEGHLDSLSLSLEIINSWNHSDESSAGEESVKLGHLCLFSWDESSRRTLATSKGSFPPSTLRQLSGITAAAGHYDTNPT